MFPQCSFCKVLQFKPKIQTSAGWDLLKSWIPSLIKKNIRCYFPCFLFFSHVGFQHGLEALLTFHETPNRWSWYIYFMDDFWLNTRIFLQIFHRQASRYQAHSITMKGEGEIHLNKFIRDLLSKAPIFAGIKGVKLHCCGFRFPGYERFMSTTSHSSVQRPGDFACRTHLCWRRLPMPSASGHLWRNAQSGVQVLPSFRCRCRWPTKISRWKDFFEMWSHLFFF